MTTDVDVDWDRASKWFSRYMQMAELVSTWSKDPGTHVGAIVVGRHGQVLATGYNGLPRGIEDTPERLNNRETKLKMTIHAEMNCIFNGSLTGISLDGSTMFVHGLPTCIECAKGIIQAGVSALVCRTTASETWAASWTDAKTLLAEAGVEIFEIDGEVVVG